MDNEFLDARRNRRRLYKKWRRTRSEEHRQELVHARQSVSQLSQIKRRDYYQNAIHSASNSQKELYKVTNNILDSSKKSVLPYTENPEHLATKFNDFFIEKIEKIRTDLATPSRPPTEILTDPIVNNVPKLCSFKPVTEAEVRKQIQGMKN